MKNNDLTVQVIAINHETPLVKHFVLESSSGQPLPAFTGGSHIVVKMTDDKGSYNNAYSLLSSPDQLSRYEIAVRLEENSKGGSAYMHNSVNLGDTLTISTPDNFFELSASADKHVLIAGGIGITPFMSQMVELQNRQADFELHYGFRSQEHGAFAKQLITAYPDHVNLCIDDEQTGLNIAELIQGLDKSAHVYVCGPKPLIDIVIETCQQAGFSSEQIHWEQFGEVAQSGNEFSVYLEKSAIELTIAEDSSILAEIEKNTSIDVECLCRNGVCGTCETMILQGEAEHLDQYLSEEEQAEQQSMMICVSRAKGQRLVLDL